MAEEEDEETERKKAERERLESEMCEHMKALIDYCRQNRVYFGGCGDCGSAWLTCEACEHDTQLAHQAFDEYYGGHK